MVHLALEAQQAQTSDPFDKEGDKTALTPLAPEAQIVPFPQELFPTLVASDIEADKAQASLSQAPEARQDRVSASFDIVAWKTWALFPLASGARVVPVPQGLFPNSLPF